LPYCSGLKHDHFLATIFALGLTGPVTVAFVTPGFFREEVEETWEG